jgi:hypothetical protein
MIDVPAWLSYVSPAIAPAALLISTASLLLAFAAYRRGGPDVRAHYRIAPSREGLPSAQEPLDIIITVTNRGLGSVDIGRFILQRGDYRGKHFQWRFGFREISINGKTITRSSEMVTTLLHAQLIIPLGNGREVIYNPGLRAYLWYIAKWIVEYKARS